jgi:hypothetical protein
MLESNKLSFSYEHDDVKLTMEMGGDSSWKEHLSNFFNFLKGIGYILPDVDINEAVEVAECEEEAKQGIEKERQKLREVFSNYLKSEYVYEVARELSRLDTASGLTVKTITVPTSWARESASGVISGGSTESGHYLFFKEDIEDMEILLA